jgi:hypothetical protein
MILSFFVNLPLRQGFARRLAQLARFLRWIFADTGRTQSGHRADTKRTPPLAVTSPPSYFLQGSYKLAEYRRYALLTSLFAAVASHLVNRFNHFLSPYMPN